MQLRPFETEPADVFLDRFDVLDVFLRGIGVIEAEVAQPAEFRRDAEVQADRLRVADVQVPVRFGRKPRVHTAAVPSRSADRPPRFPARNRAVPRAPMSRRQTPSSNYMFGLCVTRVGVR